ncbi:MAG: poly(ethylene terephthalate) hydrolase family protein, partial [Wenzhouxiangella sp.]
MKEPAQQGLSQRFTPIRRWLHRLGELAGRGLKALEPEPVRSSWIRRTILVCFLIIGAWVGAESLKLPFGLWADLLGGALVGLLMFGLGQLVQGPLLGLVRLLAQLWTPTGLAAVVGSVGLLSLIGLPLQLAAVFGLLMGLTFVLAAAGVSLLLAEPQRGLAGGISLVPTFALVGAGLFWLLGDERGEDPVLSLITPPQHEGRAWAPYLETGPYQVGSLSYGSGTDRWRREFAQDSSWQTEAVDARDLLGRPTGRGLRLRERWWGFGLDALPLNALVWYPIDAAGNLPLVLIVHGNHNMMNPSDPGYAWLGEHLASRGHVVVSVDQNFINGGLFGGVPRENGVRGWLLLEHLAAWRQWQASPEHPLHRQVDLDQVVLIGHSRGGEAVVLAAEFNRLKRYPEDARIAFDFDFGIQGVAAIAPIDGQFYASNKPTELTDVSYFVVQGGMDADVFFFAGDRQLARTRPDLSRGRFSASLYVHHANHGQFNTVWGDNDTGTIARRLLNRAWLLSGEDQRRVGLLYLTAFVEQSLVRPVQLPQLFCDPRAAGSLLPPTLYVARCDDGQRVVLADFEQGLDLEQGSLPGVRLSGIDLDLWAERDIGFRGSPQRRRAGVFLGWHAATEAAPVPSWRIELAPEAREALALEASSVLWLDLAHADLDPPPRRADPEPEDADAADGSLEDRALRPRLQIELVLEDAEGRQSRRSLNEFADLLPPLPVRHTRLDALNRER